MVNANRDPCRDPVFDWSFGAGAKVAGINENLLNLLRRSCSKAEVKLIRTSIELATYFLICNVVISDNGVVMVVLQIVAGLISAIVSFSRLILTGKRFPAATRLL